MEGGRLSQPMHCSKDVQPLPKVVYRSSSRNKHNCLRPLTPQPHMLPLDYCDLQRQIGVNNLPVLLIDSAAAGNRTRNHASSCILEYCAPLWHYALTKAQSESLEAVQKRAIRIVHIPTHGMPYSSMLFYANLSSLASRREDLSYKFFCHIADPASWLHSLLPHLDRRLSPQGLDPLKCFLKFTLARSATAPSYNMALITTSIK